MDQIDNSYKKVEVESLNENVFKIIGDDWMLITAGKNDNFNMMTASWGTMGILWHKPIAICFIRPQRYTYKFAEEYDYFTLSFFEEKYRNILQICGSRSGRNINKVEATGLIPMETELGNICYKQSRLFFECRKLYYADLDPGNFIIPEIAQHNYPTKDFHRYYIGEIINCYKRK
ncbi:MAG: flavin reductase [Bacteroidales bacterium]|nr:MAG: flavin reductase [Bacteroidales bacterium]